MKKIILLLILLLVIPGLSSYGKDSCDVSDRYVKRQLKKIRNKREKGNFDFAISRALKLQSCKPESFEVNKELALTYFESPYTKLASLPYLEKALSLDTGSASYILYYPIGVIHRMSGDYSKALDYLARYQLLLNSKGTNLGKSEENQLKVDVSREILYCNNGLNNKPMNPSTIVKNGDEYSPFINLLDNNINSVHDDYSPVLYNNNMFVFTSRRKGKFKNVNYDGRYFEDIYISDYIGKSFSAARPAVNLNTRWHDASNNSSPDGKTLYIYRGKRNGTIYSTRFENGNWTDPKALKGNINTKNWETSVAVSFGDSTVFFSSDREGGFGGRDLYISFRQKDGSWAEPINLGSGINTPDDEDSPFISADGSTLYFASNGYSSIGGFDLFKSTRTEKSWSKAISMGTSWNTPADDIYLVSNTQADTFYISSSRPVNGRNDMNIYSVTALCDTQKTVPLLVYLNDHNGKSIEGSLTILVENSPVATSQALNGKAQFNLQSGRDYFVLFQAINGSKFKSKISLPVQCYSFPYVQSIVTDDDSAQTLATFTTTLFDIKKDTSFIKADSLRLPALLTSLGSSENYKGKFIVEKVSAFETPIVAKDSSDLQTAQILFDLNKHTINEQGQDDLSRFAQYLKNHKDLQVSVTGHTDSIESDEYNLKLSKRRAQRVKEELVKLGVNERMIRIDFKGESLPVADNSSEEGRQKNRRVELKLIKNEQGK